MTTTAPSASTRTAPRASGSQSLIHQGPVSRGDSRGSRAPVSDTRRRRAGVAAFGAGFAARMGGGQRRFGAIRPRGRVSRQRANRVARSRRDGCGHSGGVRRIRRVVQGRDSRLRRRSARSIQRSPCTSARTSRSGARASCSSAPRSRSRSICRSARAAKRSRRSASPSPARARTRRR